RLARLVPQSILAGLQLGLGIALALVAVDLMSAAPVIAAVTLGVLLGLLLAPRWPAALIGLVVAVAMGQQLGAAGMVTESLPTAAFAVPVLPDLAALERAFSLLTVPQL